MGLHSSLLDILACPVTKDKLIYDEQRQELISIKSGLAFPIVDNIPIMLVTEAKKVDDKRLNLLKKKNKELG
ncbi:MAG: Trm112 family protein [Alphaproteobacteria bacterium]|nr:Trm112 family protein [Alphaproteobacteria bacterium]